MMTGVAAKALRPMELAEFDEELQGLCQQCGISIVAEGDRDYLADVQLARCAGGRLHDG